MRKSTYFLLLLIFSVTFWSCSKDDEFTAKNELVFNGEVYPLKSGKIVEYLDTHPIYTYGIQLTSSELDENDSPIDPIFHQIYFRTMTDGNFSKVNGMISSSLMVLHAEPGNNSNLEAYHVNDGTMEVRYSNGIHTVRFEGTAVNALDDEDNSEIAFSGSFSAEFVNHDEYFEP